MFEFFFYSQVIVECNPRYGFSQAHFMRKIAVPKDYQLGQLQHQCREWLKLRKDETVFMFVGGTVCTIPSVTAIVGELHEVG